MLIINVIDQFMIIWFVWNQTKTYLGFHAFYVFLKMMKTEPLNSFWCQYSLVNRIFIYVWKCWFFWPSYQFDLKLNPVFLTFIPNLPVHGSFDVFPLAEAPRMNRTSQNPISNMLKMLIPVKSPKFPPIFVRIMKYKIHELSNKYYL